jgi:hypothetical protein
MQVVAPQRHLPRGIEFQLTVPWDQVYVCRVEARAGMSIEKRHGPPQGDGEAELSTVIEGGPLSGNSATQLAGAHSLVSWRVLRRSTIFIVLALVVATLIYNSRYTVTVQRTSSGLPVSFLHPAGIGCAFDSAWSPGSAFIAVSGLQSGNCHPKGYAPSVINIYVARTGTLVRQLHPDPELFAVLGVPASVPETPSPSSPLPYLQLTYQTLLWSPDSMRLALSFYLFTSRVITGLVVLDANGEHERVLVDQQTGPQAGYTIFDLQNRSVVPAESSLPFGTSYNAYNPTTIPVAFSYGWASDGSLIPGASLLSGGRQLPSLQHDSVGNPDGGCCFGIWQPGYIEVYAVLANGAAAPTYLYVYSTSFAAWSPSGRYILDDLSVNGLLLSGEESPPSHSVLSSLQLDPIVTLPIRDAGLQQAIVQDIPLPVSLGLGLLNDIVPIAWRPDGKVVAILNQSDGFILRATDTGRILEVVNSLQLDADGLPPAEMFAILPSWSPDGTWLLLPSLALVDIGHLLGGNTRDGC